MPTPTTVLEFAQTTYDATRAAKADAQLALDAAQTDLTATRSALNDVTAALQAKEKEVAAKRLEVANADTPAEAAALVAELVSGVTELRTLQGALLEARDEVSRAESTAEHAESALTRIRGRLSLAETELANAIAEGTTRLAITTAATAPPLDTLPDTAGDALSDTPFATAQTRVTEAVPAKLLEAARRGYTLEVTRHARLELSRSAAQDLLAESLEAGEGVYGVVARRELELERAERDLRDWTDSAMLRYDRAISLLSSLGDVALLSAEESAGVQALDDTAGRDAADLRIALLDARRTVHDTELALAEARAVALAPDPGADVSAVTEVSDASDALDAANADLAAAQAAYDAVRADFDAWTAEIPDSAWRKILAFVQADSMLQALSEMDPSDLTDLVDAVTEAERNLAEALDAVEKHETTITYAEDFVARSADRLARSSATLAERLLGAVRGND